MLWLIDLIGSMYTAFTHKLATITFPLFLGILVVKILSNNLVDHIIPDLLNTSKFKDESHLDLHLYLFSFTLRYFNVNQSNNSSK